jgi:Cof subfamily protein (haloacid dehalogenase superfamily)
MISGISALISDVDGTLVTEDKVLTPRAEEAVRKLHAAGIAFAITSGRPPRGMEMLIAPLELKTPIAGFNGGVFVTPEMTVIEEHVLTADAAKCAIDLVLENKMDVWVYSGNEWFVRDIEAPHVARESWTVKFAPTAIDDFGPELDRAVKIVGVSDDLDLVKRCEKSLQSAIGTRASVACSQAYYLDITHPAANKGTVVTTLSRLLSIPTAEIATIGDGQNDVLMFREGGLSIAMGNATPAVQKQARFVSASYKDEGFAKAVEYYVLGEGERP